jgi:transcription elongation factor GreA
MDRRTGKWYNPHERRLMMSGNIHLTREGYEKLRREIEELKTVKRRQISKAIAEARAHGDLSENAEYTAAKEAQALNEKRIAELERKLARAQILDSEGMPSDVVLIGATVKLKDLDSGEELEYTLVAEEEADYASGKISVSSPVGRGLMEHKEKDTVKIEVPAGVLRYKILKITR